MGCASVKLGLEIYFIAALVVVPIVCLLNAWHARNERRRILRERRRHAELLAAIESARPAADPSAAARRDFFRVVNGGRR